jgi:hypothetical protein
VLSHRFELIKELADDLARASGGETPATRALADAIMREVDALCLALRPPKRERLRNRGKVDPVHAAVRPDQV